MQVRDAMFVMDFLDWLHIAWRLRRQYLDPERTLALGGLSISHGIIAQFLLHFKLSAADIDPSNKQSYTSAAWIERLGCL